MKCKKILLLTVTCILFVTALFLVLRSCSKEQNNTPLSEDINAVDILSSDTVIVSDDYIAILGFERLIAYSERSNIDCNIYNPERNNCYFKVNVTVEGIGDIFSSGLIAPGKAIYRIELSEPLSEGEYSSTITYYCYTFDEGKTPLNGATTHFVLEVKNEN